MDRSPTLVNWARELFSDGLDDMLRQLRQDRQQLRGWEEPAHLRAAVRRAIPTKAAAGTGPPEVALAEAPSGALAGEPGPGQQREALGQLLEAGAAALEKLAGGPAQAMSREELLGLECVLLLYGRPALLVSQGHLADVPPYWSLLKAQRDDIEMTQRGVGRIELLGHPDYDWAGTAFLVNDTTLMTTRRTAELFAEERSGQWQFRLGISAWMDYRAAYQDGASAGYRIRAVLGTHDQYDLALLEVEPPQPNEETPAPLALAAQAPPRLEGRPVYLVSYPVRDARRNEPEPIARIFRDVYNVKRVQPGRLQGSLPCGAVQLLRHDCAPLGYGSGGCLLDLETHQVLGLHLSGRYLEAGTAVPLWRLRDDQLLRRAGVTFAEVTSDELDKISSQMERLARSRHWAEARRAIGELYQRAFGQGAQASPPR